jgi:hypothetical protein
MPTLDVAGAGWGGYAEDLATGQPRVVFNTTLRCSQCRGHVSRALQGELGPYGEVPDGPYAETYEAHTHSQVSTDEGGPSLNARLE